MSKEDWKGGNCITIDYYYVCSYNAGTYFSNSNIRTTYVTEDAKQLYGIGFSNKCHTEIVNVWYIQIKWSKITDLKDVYFRDDQCFWSTSDGNRKDKGNSITIFTALNSTIVT